MSSANVSIACQMSWFDHRSPETLKRHKRLQIFSYIATFAFTAVLVLRTDWSVHSRGHEHIFSHLKPTLKAYLNRLYSKDAGKDDAASR